MAGSASRQRLLVCADLHYSPHAPHVEAVQALAEAVCRSGADALVIAGDAVRGSIETLPDCLSLFSGFRGARLFVPGNHELWTAQGDSEDVYRRIVPDLLAAHGFRMLDGAPFYLGRTAIVGNMGWYDYSLQDRRLRLRDYFYRKKSIPGMVTMNDVQFIHWRYDDQAFTRQCVEQLARDLRTASRRADRIIVVTHFVPFAELVPEVEGLPLMFARAFIGSAALGRTIRRFGKVRCVFSGHAHVNAHARIGRVKAWLVAGGRRYNTLYRLSLPEERVTMRTFRPRPRRASGGYRADGS